MSSSARLSERNLTAPSRRTVIRAAAWTAPAVSIAVAAPAHAACSSTTTNVQGTLDWDGSGVSFSRAGDRLSASATYTRSGADPLVLTVQASYVGAMKVGAESGANTNFDRQAQIGGLTVGGLKLHQSNTLAAPRPQRERRQDHGVYTFTFDRAVKNLSFDITDIDSASGDFRDALDLTSGFSIVSKASGVAGTGTATDPFQADKSNAPADNTTGGAGNVRLTYAGAIQSFSITYWNIANDFTADTDQATFLSDMSFTYASTAGCNLA